MTDVMVRPGDRARTRRRRARRFRRTTARLALIALAAAGVSFGTVRLVQNEGVSEGAVLGVSADGDQVTILVASTVLDDASQQADSLTLFGIDRSGADPVALFIPVGTLGQIPGQSSAEAVGKALIFGRESLQETTVENLLGVLVDRTVVLSDVAMARMIEAVGGIEVEVTERLLEPDELGRQQLVFPLGTTTMGGPQAVTYMTYRGGDESELERTVRAQKVWGGLVGSLAARPERRDAAAAALDELPEPDVTALVEVLAAFADTAEEERSFDVLAVESVGGGNLDEVYDLDVDAVAAQLQRAFSDSLPPLLAERGSRPRLEIRNGVGTPEIGGTAAALLVPEGFKLEVAGNTGSFGNATTRIIVYGDDDAALALADRVRSLLGVGEVEIGTRGQTVVDLTVVIGRDFVERRT